MTLVVKGAAELAARCERIAGRLENPSGAEGDLSRIFRERIERRFSSNGEGDWAGLSAETVATKARKGQDPRILRATGALHSALVGSHAQVSGQRITFGEGPFYGAIVAARRPVVPAGDSELTGAVRDALADHVMGGEA